jgi:hypothetical protein
MISSLIYSSDSLISNSSDEFSVGMNEIIRVSDLRNAEFDITGFLLYYDKKFIQIIEGDFDNVAQLYCNIRKDAHHDRCRLVDFKEFPGRAFDVWAMHNSMHYIQDHKDDLSIRLKFLHRFLDDPNHPPILIRDLLVSIAVEMQRKVGFPDISKSLRLCS